MLKFIVKFFSSLNSNSHPGEIAHAAAIGVLLGLMPKNNALWYLLFVFFLFVRINKSAYFLVILGVSLCVPSADMLLDSVGYRILSWQPLIPAFRTLLDIPFVAFTKFNNTVVMGSLAAGLLLYVPVYALTRLIVRVWRTCVAPKIVSSKAWVAFKKLPLVRKIVSVSAGIAESGK
ncbi:TIGR03546 family protein [Treponema brennaborense]|uniref:TIGR03546 family protein n=1 Tax=Treponema brennaborense (strain DSM 12168 / CIP 105900 / DD5/3) TaxID=906968 RepID=F4LNU8_TREBD|nr:TIGR03546 family protein [Treponema brennaborense]AEE16933.1 Conserved hypothetical protein CHP03546 [Treponema brennaborense DSM 12168]